MKKLAAVAAAALIMMGSVETADAQHWRGRGYHGGYYRHGGWGGGGAVAAGLIGGAILGGLITAAATPAYGYGYGYPAYGYGYGYPAYGYGYYPRRPTTRPAIMADIAVPIGATTAHDTSALGRPTAGTIEDVSDLGS